MTPVVFWLLLGLGMGNAFQTPEGGGGEGDYLAYFFPGMLVMVVLFTAIFATITLIEDRREGFMQGVLVAPVPRAAIILGKTIGGGALAWGQSLLLLALAPLSGIEFHPVGFVVAAGFLGILSVMLVGLGLCIAWPLTSTQGYHVMMNLLLMPLWFLSGAVFPLGAARVEAMGWLMRLNPLTYGLAGVRRGLNWGDAYPTLPSLGASLLISVLVSAVLLGVACFVASRPTRADAES